MTDRSVPTRELEDGSTEAFENGRWVQIAPPGTYRSVGMDAAAELFDAALSAAAGDRTDDARRRAISALRRADATGQGQRSVERAGRLLHRLEMKGQLSVERADEARRFLAELRPPPE